MAVKTAPKKAATKAAAPGLADRLASKYGVGREMIEGFVKDYGPGLARAIVTLLAKSVRPEGLTEEAKKAAKTNLANAKKALVSAAVAEHFCN